MSVPLPGSSSPEDGRPLPPCEVDWLLTNVDWVATCDAEMRCIRSGGLAIDGDTLVAVGPSEEVRERFRGLHELDLSGFLVMPGLINTHTHAAMTCFRGLGCDLPLHQWLHRVIFPAEAANVSPDLVYHGTLLAAVEMLQNGVTTFCDGYFFEESAARAALESGIRAILGQGLLDFPTPDNADPERIRDRAETFLGAFPTGRSRLRASLFCHSIYTCSARTLQWVKALCREHDILFQIHLSETASEVQDCIARNGVRPAQFLDRYGILDESTLCAHAVWLEQDEIDLLARRRVGVSHNVESNMKLASGVAPVPELLAAGVKVGLGTDGCASNNDLDLFSEMDRAAKLHKVFHKDPTACPAHAALWMASLGGAQALGWQDAIGSLEAGKKADIVAIDLNQPHLTPLYDPISHLVYAAGGSDVRHVWVDGAQVVANGRILTVDMEELAKEIHRLADGIRRSVPEC